MNTNERKEHYNKIILDKMVELKRNEDVINKVILVLNMWEGKQINKRLITKLEELVPDFIFYLHKGYTFWELSISRKSYNIRFYLCTHEDKKFSIDFFKTNNYNLNNTEKYDKLIEARARINEWVDKLEYIEKMKDDLESEMATYDCQYLLRS